MTIDAVLRQTLEVRRAVLADPAAVDAWNQPAHTADTTVVTVAGQIQPLSMREVAALTDAGAQIGDYKAFTLPADIRASDRIRDAALPAVVYEIRGLIDAAGIGDHLELVLRRVAH